MIPTAFDEENAVLDAPPGMSPEECEMVSAWRGAMDNGTPVVVTCWKVTQEEMAEIQRTGRIWVMVMGHMMPPIAALGKNPFVRQNDDTHSD